MHMNYEGHGEESLFPDMLVAQSRLNWSKVSFTHISCMSGMGKLKLLGLEQLEPLAQL